MNKTELRVYELLNSAILGSGLHVLAKVKLSDLALPALKPYTSEWQREYNRAGQKHVDFAVFSETWFPVLVIEVDGPYHQSEKQRARDEVKNEVLLAASIPILRLDAGCTESEVRVAMQKALVGLEGQTTAIRTPETRP